MPGPAYWSSEEVNRDIMQTFSNAKMFNGPLTDVHVMANTLEEFWLPRWEAICQLVGWCMLTPG